MNFLADMYARGLSYSTINTARSALSSLSTSNTNTTGSHPRVVRLLRGVFASRPPTFTYSVIWDVDLLFKHLSNSKPVESLSLEELSYKISGIS